MHIAEFESVSKSFAEKNIIKEISFSIRQGEIFGLLGPNGAGKTTLIRLLLDIIKPDVGNIFVFGAPLNFTAKDKIGYLPEERGLYKRTKILDILVYLAQLKGVSRKQAQFKAETLLRSFGLFEYEDKKVEELSKGMQQKIQFLSAIIHDPELVILDEPFSGLDPLSTREIKESILELKRAGSTVLLSTHQMEQAQTLCDRILMLNKGKRVLYGTVDEIRREYGKNSLYVELAGEISTEKSYLDSIRKIPGIIKITEHDKLIEVFPEEGTDLQVLLEEIVRKAEIKRFEQAIPSLNEIFINIVENDAFK